jgi:hypothetical protein
MTSHAQFAGPDHADCLSLLLLFGFYCSSATRKLPFFLLIDFPDALLVLVRHLGLGREHEEISGTMLSWNLNGHQSVDRYEKTSILIKLTASFGRYARNFGWAAKAGCPPGKSSASDGQCLVVGYLRIVDENSLPKLFADELQLLQGKWGIDRLATKIRAQKP